MRRESSAICSAFVLASSAVCRISSAVEVASLIDVAFSADISGDALDLPFPDQSFDVAWCQNVTMNIADKAGFLAGAYRVLKPGGIFTSTEFSTGPGGEIIFPVMWAYDASTNFLDSEDEMRAQFAAAGFRIREWTNYTNEVVAWLKQLGAPANKLTNRLVFGEDTPERAANGARNLEEERNIYWIITAERPDTKFHR